MTIELHAIAAPVFTARLKALVHLLKIGEAEGRARGLSEEAVLGARLAPDMFELKRQVQIATDHVKGAMARLAGIEVPSFPDTEQTFAELYARIDRTLAFVASVPAAAVNGREETIVTLKLRQETMELAAIDYLQGFAIPNFYFHLTTAYDILRHLGMPLGKRDFLWRQ
ncbi:conserved hypothetical protein [uncultured Pleomorphomonas sp.]|uniref:DUF1993 domain-containing protein n=1 Tax=uncultured Pleomorphomonas sp. TaxID=442121 RepID=A0A212LDW2_9HYPH|nr:DUF1993 domain-containing protein [uncultured Pleomorphomonas sp.]SCM75677.1 conserved hypothetical protein [uncultured Pleomorphomonas sp.]